MIPCDVAGGGGGGGAGTTGGRGTAAMVPGWCRMGKAPLKVTAVPPTTWEPASARASTAPPVTAAESTVGRAMPAGAVAAVGLFRRGLRRMGLLVADDGADDEDWVVVPAAVSDRAAGAEGVAPLRILVFRA
jgi:hypothetical protein